MSNIKMPLSKFIEDVKNTKSFLSNFESKLQQYVIINKIGVIQLQEKDIHNDRYVDYYDIDNLNLKTTSVNSKRGGKPLGKDSLIEFDDIQDITRSISTKISEITIHKLYIVTLTRTRLSSETRLKRYVPIISRHIKVNVSRLYNFLKTNNINPSTLVQAINRGYVQREDLKAAMERGKNVEDVINSINSHTYKFSENTKITEKMIRNIVKSALLESTQTKDYVTNMLQHAKFPTASNPYKWNVKIQDGHGTQIKNLSIDKESLPIIIKYLKKAAAEWARTESDPEYIENDRKNTEKWQNYDNKR